MTRSSHQSAAATLRSVLLIVITGIIIFWPRSSMPVFSQSSGMVIRPEDGHSAEVAADGKSDTWLVIDLDNCDFGVPVEPDGTISLSISTSLGKIDPPFATSMDGGPFPPFLHVLPGTQTGEARIEVIASYCPAGAVVMMGVCAAQGYDNATCLGSTTVRFIPPENDQPGSGAPTAQAESAQAETPPTANRDQAAEGDADQNKDPQLVLAELYADLEEFLAGEGITAPTPGQVGATGIAITTLLAGWIVLNQMAGTSVERSFDVIKAWKAGERPQIGAEVDLPAGPGDQGGGIKADLPDDVPEPTDPDATHVTPRTPVQEGGEDRVLRGIKDAQDLDDALKKTNKDLEAFEGKIPDAVKDTEAWKKHVAPKLKGIQDLAKKGELDKARTWLDRAEPIIQVRNDLNRDLDHLPPEQREGVIRLVQSLKVFGHVLSDAYNSAVIDPAKAAGSKLLPPDLAQRWENAMNETSQALSEVGQGIPAAVEKGARDFTHGDLMDQAEQMSQDQSPEIREDAQRIKDLYVRKNVDRFDPWGKGTRKAKELWDHTMRSLFHDR